MRRLAQSTSVVVMLKVFLSSDHITAATSKTVAITISKNGGAFGNPSAGATNATEVSGGWYKVTLSTTDTATIGDLVVVGTATACDISDQICQVVDAATGGATNLDSAVSGRMATYTQPTGFLAATFPTTVASTTNITAGTMTTTTNLTTNNDKTGYTLSNTGMDNLLDRSAGIETNRTLRQGLRLMLAALVGKASGLATTTATFRDTNDGVNRIVATVDADGNRSAVTLDAS